MKAETSFSSIKPGKLNLEERRAIYYDISEHLNAKLDAEQKRFYPAVDLVYRTLCAVLFNFVPTSGHPGGSISSGRIVESLIYDVMDYNFSDPDADDADMLIYAAGHKAMGLYAMWALRNELIRVGDPVLLPDARLQLRLEDLLGFRRNPTNETPLFKKFMAKALDGHPTPATPFVKIATGASGVGVPAGLGLALGALDIYGDDAPRVHLLEGEGGMTPGRVHEALAAGASMQLHNTIMHIDWNQASIDSNQVCRDGNTPGDYVQWNPAELCYCHDWNVIFVPDGTDFTQILTAQKLAPAIENKQPTAIVYKTTKGWKYGIEGKASHGAGHKFCSDGFYQACGEFEETFDVELPRFSGEPTPEAVEEVFFNTLLVFRSVLKNDRKLPRHAANRIRQAKQNLEDRNRQKRDNAPNLLRLYKDESSINELMTPPEVLVRPGDSVTLRAVLGNVLNVLNKTCNGAIIGAAADLLNSTSVANLNNGFEDGYLNTVSNPNSRLVAIGGICEDAMGAFMAGLSSFGHHIGVTSSYGAFIGALEHVAARLHGIGQQSKAHFRGEKAAYNTWIMINAHAGVKTGEDGPTHADPQVLQLLQENFPRHVLITLTPWDAQELWPLMVAGLKARPAVLAPFVTRPADKVVDRSKLGLPPAHAAIHGVYAMRKADRGVKQQSGTLVLQGNGVATTFVQEVLPVLDQKGLNLNIYYVASAELFNRLSAGEREALFPEELKYSAMGITDFTLPTMYRWVRSNAGLRRTLHSFRADHYLGSGQAHKVLEEAGIHAKGQLAAILDYAKVMETQSASSVKTRTFYPEIRSQVTPHPEKVTLKCTSCGTLVDPKDYFTDEPMPRGEVCAECEYRSPEVCPYCKAFWLNENFSLRFQCGKCRA